MPAIATTHSLSDYSKLSISRYRDQLKNSDTDSLQMRYSYKGKPYSYSINLSKTACHYGGYRYWWLCPNCSKRVSVLYCARRYLCRHCIGANYSSQLQQPIDRIYSKLNDLRERLGWQVGIINGIGSKPRYMHHRTYKRLVSEYEQLTNELIRASNATT